MGIDVHITLGEMSDTESFRVTKMRSITRRQAIFGTFNGLLVYVASASALADDCIVDLSGGEINDPNWCHSDPVPTPTVPGLGLAALGGLLLVLARKFYRR